MKIRELIKMLSVIDPEQEIVLATWGASEDKEGAIVTRRIEFEPAYIVADKRGISLMMEEAE